MNSHSRVIVVSVITISLYSAALSASAQSRRTQQSVSEQRAQQIWEQAVSAKGGRDRLNAVENLVISTSGEYARAAGKKTQSELKHFLSFRTRFGDGWIIVRMYSA
jgi:hypothetical protein